MVIASMMLYSKKRTLATTLILIGSSLAFLFNLGNIFISVFAHMYGTETFVKINAISNVVSGLAYLTFCIGVLLFAIHDFKKEVPKNP